MSSQASQTTQTRWLKTKDLGPAIHERFGFLVSTRTISRWRSQRELKLPCTEQRLGEWFEAIMNEKNGEEPSNITQLEL